jgi:hypothetical protein
MHRLWFWSALRTCFYPSATLIYTHKLALHHPPPLTLGECIHAPAHSAWEWTWRHTASGWAIHLGVFLRPSRDVGVEIRCFGIDRCYEGGPSQLLSKQQISFIEMWRLCVKWNPLIPTTVFGGRWVAWRPHHATAQTYGFLVGADSI